MRQAVTAERHSLQSRGCSARGMLYARHTALLYILLAGAAATCGEEVSILQVRGEERRLFPAHRITAAQVSRISKVL